MKTILSITLTEAILENKIDTFIDEMTESYATYGGVLVRKTKSARPEVVDLRSLPSNLNYYRGYYRALCACENELTNE